MHGEIGNNARIAALASRSRDVAVLRLSELGRAQIAARVREAYPREACGLLLGEQRGASLEVVAVRAARNLSARADGFELDPSDQLAAEREAERLGTAVCGVWHSHPDRAAVLSPRDRAAAWDRWANLVVAVDARGVLEMRAWRVLDARTSTELAVSIE